MNLRPLSRISGLLGGACWLVRLVLGDGAAGDALYLVGLVLLFLALIGFGIALVSKGAVWLQAIVGVAFPLLVWSVLEVLHRSGSPETIDAVVGLVVAAACAHALHRERGGDERPPRRHAGAHAR